MKKKLYVIFLTFFASSALMLLLWYISEGQKNDKNGFIRLFPPHKIIGVKFADLKFDTWYLCGVRDSTIHLGNYLSVMNGLKIDSTLNNITPFSITGLNDQVTKFSTIAVDSNHLYFLDGLSRKVYFSGREGYDLSHKLSIPSFTSAQALNSQSYILRSINKSKQNVLSKFSKAEGITAEKNGLLKKQVDGIFCTDGMLIKTPSSSKLFYIYYYRNDFLCTDTNLKLIYQGKTIDTVTRANLKSTQLKQSRQIVLTAPPKLVNSKACVSDRYLFINSALKANNESSSMFEKGSVIDIYSVDNGKYLFSFYLPTFKGRKIRDFKVYGNNLYALYDHYIYYYKLNF